MQEYSEILENARQEGRRKSHGEFELRHRRRLRNLRRLEGERVSLETVMRTHVDIYEDLKALPPKVTLHMIGGAEND